MSEAYNALVRFAVYGGVLLFLATQKPMYLAAIPLVMLATYALVQAAPADGKEGFTSARKHLEHIACMKPTKENPYMNMAVHEYADNPDRSPACDLQRPAIKKAADAALTKTHDLYMDTSDETSRRTLERTFVSVPVTTSCNDLDAVKSFFYGDIRHDKRLTEGYVPRLGSSERPVGPY